MTTEEIQAEIKKNRKKWDLIYTLLSLMFIGSLAISYMQERETIEVSEFNHKQLIDSISKLNTIQTISRAENKIYYASFIKMLEDRSQIQQIQKQITKSYEKLQDQIQATPDSMQYGLTLDLLAKHKSKPLERDQ